MPDVSDSPPRAPPIKYTAPLGTRWDKEKAAAGGAAAFDLPTDPKNIGPWILGECVGKGASGRVKIAKHRRTGQLAAVKILPIAPLVSSRASLATQQAKSDKQRLGIDREITMMKLMNHPNIMRIYDVFEGDQELFLVLEYVEGGELFDFLVNRGRLPPNEALIYFRQIVYGLNYAHTFSIIHRDLKPENILIASLQPPLIKIADWGMAAFAPPTLQLETSCGSPHYASPEIVNGEKYQGNATDIWSCGVILYALLTGRLPFDDKNVRSLLSKVKSGKYEMPTWIDPLAKDLLSRMLIVDVHKRITVPEILSHPWLISQPLVPYPCADGGTISVLAPPLPPSPSILARPITSPDLIDAELFLSLRIIWGRHTDPQGDSIRRDLCAPAGQGVHAKAFYFLLGKYREESSRNRSNDELDSRRHSLSSSIDLETFKFNLGWELDQSGAAKKLGIQKNPVSSTPETTVSAPTSAITPMFPSKFISEPAPPVMPRKRTFTDGSLPLRDRPESPLGPRPPPKINRARTDAQRDISSSVALTSHRRPKSSSGSARLGPRPLAPRRGYTYSASEKRDPDSSEIGPSSIGFSHHLHQLQARISSNSSQRPRSSAGPTVPFTEAEKKAMFSESRIPSVSVRSRDLPITRPPTPVLAPIVASPHLANDLPPLTVPQFESPHPQHTTDDITQKVNDLVHAVTQPQAHVSVTHATDSTKVFVHSNDKQDKENQTVDDEGWNHVSADIGHSGGIGLGVGLAEGRAVGRDLANVGSTVAKAKKDKDKKGRPPPLELPLLNPKRSAFAILGSPIALSSPVHQSATSSSRILTSPVVGEFKGWFSNLFNWKPSSSQGGVLYSVDDLQQTRLNIARLLEGIGINLGHSAADHLQPELSNVLLCRIDQPTTDPVNGITLKSVRFRVEFKAGPRPPDSQIPMTHNRDDNAYFLAAPAGNPNQLATGNGNAGNSSRPRASVLLGRSVPLVSPVALPKWDFPPGCLCAIALIYEKGSMSTFRAVWRQLKAEYGDASTAYPCSSPAILNTPGPFSESHPQRGVPV
ncbi:Pkinase-domain-containing protein [Phlegmacium glaucopus]|nr:Pkinase-domain-containing protein [Phlegmacium glaucopus]